MVHKMSVVVDGRLELQTYVIVVIVRSRTVGGDKIIREVVVPIILL